MTRGQPGQSAPCSAEVGRETGLEGASGLTAVLPLRQSALALIPTRSPATPMFAQVSSSKMLKTVFRYQLAAQKSLELPKLLDFIA